MSTTDPPAHDFAGLAWTAWADQREQETTWRRDKDGTPDNQSAEEFCFRAGYAAALFAGKERGA